MDYKEFKNIFNKQIFESSKRILLEKIAENPERYVGSFRPTKMYFIDPCLATAAKRIRKW